MRQVTNIVSRARHVCLGALLALLAWSVIISLAVWRPTGYRDDPDLGRVYRPGLYVHGVEGFSWSHINSLGFRGAETPKGEHDTRLLFLGDSYTEAFQVPENSTFVRRTASLLKRKGVEVEAVNAGRSGASPASFLYLAGWYERNLDPTIVVIQVSDDDFQPSLTDPNANFYLTARGSKVEPHINREFVSANPLARQVPFSRVLLSVPIARLAADNVSRVVRTPAARSSSKEVSGDRELVGSVVRALSEAYDDPIILYLPTIDYEGDLYAGTSTERLVKQSAERYGLTLVCPRGEMADRFLDDDAPAHGFANTSLPNGGSHLNSEGHATVAAELAPVIAQRLDE